MHTAKPANLILHQIFWLYGTFNMWVRLFRLYGMIFCTCPTTIAYLTALPAIFQMIDYFKYSQINYRKCQINRTKFLGPPLHWSSYTVERKVSIVLNFAVFADRAAVAK